MGRPKSDNPRNLAIRLRLTEKEYNKLKSFSDQTGESVSDILRCSAFEYVDKCRSGRLVSDKEAQG